MRAPAASEIVLLARVLTRLAPDERPFMARAIIAETEAAERHQRMTGHAHPTFGDGSLMTRCARLSPPPEPLADDREFLLSMIIAANAVLIHSGA